LRASVCLCCAQIARVLNIKSATTGSTSKSFSNAVSLRVQPQLVLTLREALARAPGIKAAFVYGSVAQGRETAASDIDLMVIGADVTYADCFAGLLTAENLLKRPIHAQFVSAEDWRRKLARGSAFVTKVNARPKIFIFGSAEDLRR
jgi:predicted nucleotidyltransferase